MFGKYPKNVMVHKGRNMYFSSWFFLMWLIYINLLQNISGTYFIQIKPILCSPCTLSKFSRFLFFFLVCLLIRILLTYREIPTLYTPMEIILGYTHTCIPLYRSYLWGAFSQIISLLFLIAITWEKFDDEVFHTRNNEFW